MYITTNEKLDCWAKTVYILSIHTINSQFSIGNTQTLTQKMLMHQNQIFLLSYSNHLSQLFTYNIIYKEIYSGNLNLLIDYY